MSHQDPQSPGPPPPPPPEGTPPPSSKDENMWAMFCHLSGLALLTCIPFANVIGPLIIWLIQREKMPFVDDQGKEAVNFQITMLIPLLVACALTAVLCFALPLPVAVIIFDLVMIIIAALKANAGERYRYPLCIRFIK